MTAYSTATKPFSRATEKRENKISRQFQLNEKPEIFETVRVKEDALCEKSCRTYFPKNEVFFSSYLWLTYEMEYFYEDFKDNSKSKSDYYKHNFFHIV